MKQKSVGLTLRALILALALSLVVGTPALPPFEDVAYAQTGTGLTAGVAPDNSSVTLTWTAVDGADSYEIWRGEVVNNLRQWGDAAYATVQGGDVTTYTDTNVMAGKTYGYGVRAVTDGTAAAWRGPYPNVEIPGGTPKPTERPTVSVAASGTTAVIVTWTSISGVAAGDYQIQFWHSGLNDWEIISGNHASGYEHTGRTPGTEYYYVVRGTNAGGEGPWSSWRDDNSKITLQATTAVPELSFDHQSRNTVVLTWTPTTNAANYDLQRKKVVTGGGADAGTWARLPDDLLSASTRTYTDSAATFGTITGADTTTRVTYYYRVQARDSGGVGGDWSNEVMVAIPETGAILAAPAAPTTPAISNTSIRVEWTAVPDATYYRIQWKVGDGSWETPEREDGTTFTHTGLAPSTKYTYRVQAVNINGGSDWSPEKSATTRAGTSATGELKMPKVTGLTVMEATTTATDGTVTHKIKLTWNAVSGATHYDILRYSPGDTTPAWAAPADVTDVITSGRITVAAAKSPPTWTDESDALTAGSTYDYVVSAVDDGPDDAAAGDDDLGEFSDIKGVTLKDYKPPMPTGLTATATSETSIWVSWTAAAFDRAGDPATGATSSYKLQWRRDGQSYLASNVMDVDTMTYHHTGLRANTTYWYRVLAVNSGGMSDYATEMSGKTLPQRLAPPGNLSAVDATTDTAPAIKISWSAVAGATGYEIQRFGTAWGDLEGTAGNDTDVASGTTVTDAPTTPLTANTTYNYRVRTVVGDVKSEWSTVVSGMTKAAAPAAPTLVATAAGTSMIRLSWGTVSGATAYELEYVEGSLDADGFGNVRITRMDMTLGGNLRHYVHTGLKSGTLYSYRLRAALPQGVYSAWSAVAGPHTKPARPMLTATATMSTTIQLTWDAVPFMTDTGTAGHLDTADGSNYQVQRRMSGTTAWTAVEETPACVEATNKCTLTDEGLTKGTLYWYRIRAVTTTTPVLRSYWDQENQRTPSR